jgi:hypothetical protein
MYYAKIENGQFVRRCNVADEVPATITFTTDPTAEELAPYDVVIVHDSTNLPAHNEETQGLVDATPTLAEDGKWYANYTVVDKV